LQSKGNNGYLLPMCRKTGAILSHYFASSNIGINLSL
jgi:hypothetical protein